MILEAPKSSAAIDAEKEFDGALRKAKAEYDAKVKVAIQLYLPRLDRAMKGATMKGDLPEANRILALRKSVEDGNGPTVKTMQTDSRKVWIGVVRTYVQESGGKWTEYAGIKLAEAWKETSRTSEYVEAFDERRKMWGRFFDDGLYTGDDRKGWSLNMRGSWKK